jgi:hypothetical protein
MKIHPKDIDGISIAILIWDQSDEGGGSFVMFGTARFTEDGFFVERDRKPHRMPIPESAWENLRRNPDRSPGTTFETAEFIVMLRLGTLPEGVASLGGEIVEMPDFGERNPK